jgi:hypothetical protein
MCIYGSPQLKMELFLSLTRVFPIGSNTQGVQLQLTGSSQAFHTI